MRVAVPCIRLGDLLRVSPHFGRAPLFAIYELASSGPRLVALEENPAIRTVGERGEAIARLLARHGVNAVIVYEIGLGAYSKLASRGIRVYVIDELATVEEVLHLFKEGKLVEVKSSVKR